MTMDNKQTGGKASRTTAARECWHDDGQETRLTLTGSRRWVCFCLCPQSIAKYVTQRWEFPGAGRSVPGKGTGLFWEPPPHAFNETSAAVPSLGIGMAVGCFLEFAQILAFGVKWGWDLGYLAKGLECSS